MGGEVTCTSQVGKGSEFKIKLSSYCIVSKTVYAEKQNYVILEKSCTDKKIKCNVNMKVSSKMLAPHKKEFKKIDSIEDLIRKMKKF